MEDLRRGEVMIANWHRLAKQETSSVNGGSARVVKTGEPVEVVKNAGTANETVELRYVESDRAWLKRIRSELGNGRGRRPHWLVFKDATRRLRFILDTIGKRRPTNSGRRRPRSSGCRSRFGPGTAKHRRARPSTSSAFPRSPSTRSSFPWWRATSARVGRSCNWTDRQCGP